MNLGLGCVTFCLGVVFVVKATMLSKAIEESDPLGKVVITTLGLAMVGFACWLCQIGCELIIAGVLSRVS